MINASNCIRTLVCFIVGALCLLAGAPRLAQAQTTATNSPDYFITSGIYQTSCGQGETILIHLAFPAGLVRAQAGTPPATVSAYARLTDLNGRVLFTGNNETITVNGMRTESVSRRQLDVPQTGPLTLLAEWVISAPVDFAADLPSSAEVVDACSGRVLDHTGQRLTLHHRPVPGRSNVFAVWVTLGFQPVSLAYGQTLRLNIAQQWPLGVPLPTAAGGDFFLKIEGIEGESKSVAERHLNFLPGQTLVVDFNRDLITELGDPGTGRLTVWLVVEYRAMLSPVVLGSLWNGHDLPQFPASLQLVDNSNPSAIALILPAVQKLREACTRNGCP